jgi:hypothetical protein
VTPRSDSTFGFETTLPKRDEMLATNRHAALLSHLTDAEVALGLLVNDAESSVYDDVLLKLVRLKRDVKQAIKAAHAAKGAPTLAPPRPAPSGALPVLQM